MYLVAYDISDTKIRTKIAHYLEGKGIRIQKSVFMLDVNKNKIVPIMLPKILAKNAYKTYLKITDDLL